MGADGRHSEQCERWRERVVKVQTVRELWGVVSHEHAHGAVCVTAGRVSQGTRDLARGKQCRLIDGAELLAAVAGGSTRVPAIPRADAVVVSPSCPRCGGR